MPTVSFSTIATELVAGSAVLLTIGVVRKVWQRGDGIIDAEPGCKVPGQHAIVVVGIVEGTDEISRRLIIKNSWGRAWGDDGYGLVSQRYLNAYGVCIHVLDSAA